MSKKINIGILGCADIAKRFLIPSIQILNEYFNISSIASRDINKSNKFANQFNIESSCTYQELIDNKNLDAIYIPLPTGLHYEWVKKSLNKGLHVLVEKSLACNYEEVVELNNLAKDKGLALIESFQFRFHSQLEYIKNILKDGLIGELRNIKSSFGLPPFEDSNNIRYQKNLCGGALLDVGVYTIKISQIFLGNDVYVDSASLFQDKKRNIDIWGSAYIKNKNTKIASQISFGFDNFYQNTLELWGSKGKISTNRIFTAPPNLNPIIELETEKGKEIIKLDRDHHFKNILLYFYQQIIYKDNIVNEYNQNIIQAKLVMELKDKANK